MKSPITKLAVAAAVMITVAGILHFVTSIDRSATLLANAIQKVKRTHSAMWRERRSVTREGEDVARLNLEVVRYYSSEYGGREDTYSAQGNMLLNQVYWLIQENTRTRIAPLLKRYDRAVLTEAERRVWGQISVEDGLDLAKGEKPRRLGRKEINGREAEGFEIKGAKTAEALSPVRVDSIVARFWIDVETCLLLAYEAEVITSDPYVTFLTNGKTLVAHVTGYDPQWNVDLEPSVFKFDVPPDYTLMEREQP